MTATTSDTDQVRLTTTEIADLIGMDCHALSASITKLWWSYLHDQEAQVGNGRRRSYAPIDAVVIDMLVSTGELGGDVVNVVREEFAAQIYEAFDDHDAADAPLPEQLRHPRIADGRIAITFQPSWFLIERAAAVGEAAAR